MLRSTLLYLLFAAYATAQDVHSVGEDVQMSGEETDTRKLTQNPQSVAEMIMMQGVGTEDIATVTNGDSTLSSSVPYGKAQCIGAFDTTKSISVKAGTKTLGPIALNAGTPKTGNIIFYSDMYSATQAQFAGVNLKYENLQPHFDAGKGVMGFFSLVYGKSFQVMFANTNQRIVSSISNMQSVGDAQFKTLDPSKIQDGADGFQLRDMDMNILAVTPHSVKDFIKPGKVTIVFIVGTPSNLTNYPYKIVAMDLSCNLVSDSAVPLPKPLPEASGSPLIFRLWPIVAALLGFLA